MSAIPSGFHAADRLQVEAFEATGSIPGASKVTILEDGTLCTRLRPPRSWDDVKSPCARRQWGATGGKDGLLARDWYVGEYNTGWAAGRRGGESGPFQDGSSSMAYDDGYLDAAVGRMKWHLTYCPNHDECGEA